MKNIEALVCRRMVLRLYCHIVCVMAMAWLSTPVTAAEYPVRPIRLIVPFPAGATADIAARMLAQKASELLGQPIVVDNRVGGSTIIGTDIAAKAPPDGYTMVSVPFNYSVNPVLFKKLPYDSLRDLKAVALLGLTPTILVVHPSIAVRSVREFISLATSNPGKFNYGSAGEGSSNHLAAELFKLTTHVDVRHVPYKGAAPAVTALSGGEVSLMFSGLTSALAQIQSGRLRPLAVAGVKRSSVLPQVLTLAEAGVAGCEVSAWHGPMVPTGTPREIILKLNSVIGRVLAMPDVIDRFSAIGLEPGGGLPEDFERFIYSEMRKWSRVVAVTKMKSGI